MLSCNKENLFAAAFGDSSGVFHNLRSLEAGEGAPFTKPEWKIWTKALSDKQNAMDQDSVEASRPIHRTIKDPGQAFDSVGITYEKGMTVLRMFEDYLGPDTFRDGIRRYLDALVSVLPTTWRNCYRPQTGSRRPSRCLNDVS
jgi:aminopeptidase N